MTLASADVYRGCTKMGNSETYLVLLMTRRINCADGAMSSTATMIVRLFRPFITSKHHIFTTLPLFHL